MGSLIPTIYLSKSYPRKSQVLLLWMKQFSSFVTILAGNLLNERPPLVILVSTLLADWSFFVHKMRVASPLGCGLAIPSIVYFHRVDITSSKWDAIYLNFTFYVGDFMWSVIVATFILFHKISLLFCIQWICQDKKFR